MVSDNIKALAKQAGTHNISDYGNNTWTFHEDQLAEFVRLVREQAFTEAASVCAIQGTGWLVNPRLDGCGGAIALNNAAHDIRSLK